MRNRTIGTVLVAALAAVTLAGCVADPYGRRVYRGYDGRHDRDYDYRGARQDYDRDWDHKNYKLPTLVCASKNGRPTRCPTKFAIRRADLDKRYSGSPCTYGRTWGYDHNEVWVTDGCRARFVLTPAGRRR